MQIAKMFASLGFNVDLSGLINFKSSLGDARGEMTNLGRGTKQTTQQLRGLSRALDGIDSRLNRIKGSAVNKTIRDGYNDIASSVRRIDTAFQSITNNQKHTTKALGKIHAGVKAGVPLWDKYKESVLAVRDALRQVNARLVQIRGNAQIRVRLGSGGTRGNGGGGGDGGDGNSGNNRRNSSSSFDLSGGGFFRSMMPATAIAGGATSAGFAVKEVVERGRDQMKVDNTLRMNSLSNEEYVKSLKFIREESDRLGVSNVEFGRAYAKLRGDSADSMSLDQLQKVMSGFSEYMLVLGSSADDQKGVFRALSQMMTNITVQGDDLNQMAERGISKGMFQKEAMKYYGLKSMDDYRKFQEAGKVVTADVAPIVAELLSKKSRQGGALEVAQRSSLAEQERLISDIGMMSKSIMEGGLDQALASMFRSLSEILVVLEEITLGFKTFKLALDDVTSGNGLLTIGLTILVGILFKKRQMLVGILRNFTSFSGIMRVITGFMNGRFGQAILLVVKRFGFVGAIITSVIWLMQKIGETMKVRANGEWTWIDTLIVKFEILKNHLALTMAQLRIFFHNAQLSVSPTWWSRGEIEQVKVIGEESKGKYDIKPPEFKDSEFNETFKNFQENLNKRETLQHRTPTNPLERINKLFSYDTPNVKNTINVNINGVPVPQRQISISEAINA